MSTTKTPETHTTTAAPADDPPPDPLPAPPRFTWTDVQKFMPRLERFTHRLRLAWQGVVSKNTDDLRNSILLRMYADGQRSWKDEAYFIGTYRIVGRRQLIDWARENNVRVDTKALASDEDFTRFDRVSSPLRNALHDALAQLEKDFPTEAALIQAHFYAGETYVEIGERLGVHFTKVHKDVKAALGLLYGWIDDFLSGNAPTPASDITRVLAAQAKKKR